jgi:methylenetetrahydrofolate--tRNA-(uracil-5-)-methyltransferase
MAGVHAASIARGREPVAPPRATAMGSLVNYVANADPKRFQPANITFALLPPLEPDERRRLKQKRQRHERQVAIGLEAFAAWLDSYARAAAPAGY